LDKEDKKESKNINYCPIRLASLLDLGRLAFSTMQDSRNLYAIELKGVKSLCILGEFIGGVSMLYNFPAEKEGNYAVYNPKDAQGLESFDITNDISSSNDIGTYKIPIIELESGAFKEKEIKQNKILYVRAKDYKSIINAVISNSAVYEGPSMVYRFTSNGKAYVGSFEIIKDDKKIFVYAEDEDTDGAFYAYDYSTSTIRKVDKFSENSYTYVRIIKLASQMPYFKG